MNPPYIGETAKAEKESTTPAKDKNQRKQMGAAATKAINEPWRLELQVFSGTDASKTVKTRTHDYL